MTLVNPESTTVADALARHYVEHGLALDGGEHERWFRVRIGPLAFALPNPPARQRAVLYHDINHVITGYNTVFSDGEMVIAGHELGSGCGPYWIAWLINLGIFPLGLLRRPGAMFRAFLRGRRAESVYRWEDRATLRGMTVSALRVTLGVPQGMPPARASDYLIFTLWSVVAVTFELSPLLAAFVVWSVLS